MNFQKLCFLQCFKWNIISCYHNKWGGLMVRVFASILKVKGSNFMGGGVCGQQWYVDQNIFLFNPYNRPRLITWPTYLPKLGF
jgi:hypothetical protein